MGNTGRTFQSLFFFQAEDGIRDVAVTGVQTCALPISIFQLFGFTFLASLTQVYRKPFGPRSRLDSPIEVWPKRRQNFRYSCNGKKRGLPTVCRITPRLP